MRSTLLNREFGSSEEMIRAELKFLRECRESLEEGLTLCTGHSGETQLRAEIQKIDEEIAKRGEECEPEYMILLRKAQAQLAEAEQLRARPAVKEDVNVVEILERIEHVLGQTHDPLLREIGKYARIAVQLIR